MSYKVKYLLFCKYARVFEFLTNCYIIKALHCLFIVLLKALYNDECMTPVVHTTTCIQNTIGESIVLNTRTLLQFMRTSVCGLSKVCYRWASVVVCSSSCLLRYHFLLKNY